MQVILTAEESEKVFFNALCGADVMAGYGVTMDYSNADAQKAQATLKAAHPKSIISREDLWMEILRQGGTLTLDDEEGEGENTASITMKDVHERVNLVDQDHLQDAVNEEGDATTDDVILQTVFFKEVIFG